MSSTTLGTPASQPVSIPDSGVGARRRSLRRFGIYALKRLGIILATILIGVYITVIVSNGAGQLDERTNANIDLEIRRMRARGWMGNATPEDRMTATEQVSGTATRHMSRVLWDLFTGSAPYREVLRNALHPGFVMHISWNLLLGMVTRFWRLPDNAR